MANRIVWSTNSLRKWHVIEDEDKEMVYRRAKEAFDAAPDERPSCIIWSSYDLKCQGGELEENLRLLATDVLFRTDRRILMRYDKPDLKIEPAPVQGVACVTLFFSPRV